MTRLCGSALRCWSLGAMSLSPLFSRSLSFSLSFPLSTALRIHSIAKMYDLIGPSDLHDPRYHYIHPIHTFILPLTSSPPLRHWRSDTYFLVRSLWKRVIYGPLIFWNNFTCIIYVAASGE